MVLDKKRVGGYLYLWRHSRQRLHYRVARLHFAFTITSCHVERKSIDSELARFWMLLDKSYRWALRSINCSILLHRFSLQYGETKKLVHSCTRLDKNQDGNIPSSSYFFSLFFFCFDVIHTLHRHNCSKKRTHVDPVFNMWWLTRKQTGHEKKAHWKLNWRKLKVPMLSIQSWLSTKKMLLLIRMIWFTERMFLIMLCTCTLKDRNWISKELS